MVSEEIKLKRQEIKMKRQSSPRPGPCGSGNSRKFGEPCKKKKNVPVKRTDSLHEDFIMELKEQANRLYAEKSYDTAISKYTMLIALCPNNEIYYENRAACYMIQKEYEKAMDDVKKSVEINPQYIKGHCGIIKCAIVLHALADMNRSVEKLREIDPTNDVLMYQSEKMTILNSYLKKEAQAAAAKTYIKALEYIDRALKICPFSLSFRIKKAERLANLERFAEAKAIANEVLDKDQVNAEAQYVLGLCQYQTNVEESWQHFANFFRLCPDADKDRELYMKAQAYIEQKTEANDAYKSQDFFRAYQLYRNALKVDPNNNIMQGTLYFNTSQAVYKLDLLDTCIKACGKALLYIPDHVKALMRRAQCYADRKQYAKAIEDLERASSIEPSAEITEKLWEAKRLLEAHKHDFHVILGVPEGASVSEVTEAYRELTKIHHPDRHVNATAGEKKFHEQKCKDITRAYRLLMEQKSAGRSDDDDNCDNDDDDNDDDNNDDNNNDEDDDDDDVVYVSNSDDSSGDSSDSSFFETDDSSDEDDDSD